MFGLNHELERIHEGLGSCARFGYRQVGTGASGEIPGSWDPTPVHPSYQRRLETFARSIGWPISYTRNCREQDSLGACRTTLWGTQDIVIDERQSAASKFRVGCHELAHAILRNDYHGDYINDDYHELIAESVAGIVTGKLAMTDGKFSSVYLWNQCQSWYSPERELQRVRPLAVEISARLLALFGVN